MPIPFFRLYLLLWVFLPAISWTQPFAVRHIDVEQGLPASSVRCIKQDQKGFLWIGTLGGGLAQFDGNHWRKIPTEDTRHSATINAIHEDVHQRLWIGTDKGLALLSDQRLPVALNGLPKDLITEKIYFVQSHGQSEGWVGTETGLWWYKNGKLYQDMFRGLPATPIRAFTRMPEGWAAATNQGLFLLQGKKWEKWAVPGEGVHALLWDSVHHRLVLGHAQGISFLEHGGLTHLALGEAFMENYTTCLTAMKDGSIWAGTLTYPVRIVKDHFTRIGEPPFPLHNSIIQSIFQDREERIWLGTFEGLDGLQPKTFIPLQYPEWQKSPANHILAMPDETFWISTDQGAFQWKDGQLLSSITEKQGLPSPGVTMMAMAPDRGLWMNVVNASPILYREGKISYPLAQTYPFPNLHFIRTLPDQSLAITGAGGLLWIKDQTTTVLTYPEDLPFHIVYDVALGKDGALWVSGNGGLCRWKKDEPLRFWNPDHGLPEKLVYSVRVDEKGRVWAVNFGGGLICITKDSLKVVPQPAHIPYREWTALALSADGQDLWLGGLHGVAHVQTQTQAWEWFNEEDGINGPVVIDGMALQPDGTLLIGTTKGMVWKRPGQPNLETSPTLPYLSEIQCDGAKWPESQWVNRSQFTFSPGYHTLQFRAKALDLGGSTKHRFRYRFLGASEVWVESKTGEITWLDAPPGEYRLEIQVLNAKQEPGEKLSLSLHLPFKWYQQTLVQVAFALAILLVLWLFIWRWIRMREKNIQEKARLHEQVSVLELKTIQQKLNPHFLTNALSNLHSLLRYGEKEKAQDYLENFGQILYQSLHQQDKDAISLKEELDFFRYYFDVENMRLEQSVTLRMDLEDGLDLDDLWVPPLITQPLVENAFKHAFAAGQAGVLWVQIYSQEDQVLGMTVTSTGLPMYEQKNRIGLGLSLVKKRMEKVYGMAPSAWVTWKKTNDNQFEVRLRFPQS